MTEGRADDEIWRRSSVAYEAAVERATKRKAARLVGRSTAERACL